MQNSFHTRKTMSLGGGLKLLQMSEESDDFVFVGRRLQVPELLYKVCRREEFPVACGES